MEGIEFQLRSQHDTLNTRPTTLTLDERLAQGDQFRHAKEKLINDLQVINEFQSTAAAGCHSGSGLPDCPRCRSTKRETMTAFYDYYVSPEPNRWDSKLHQYREEITRMFNDPELQSLEDIHALFRRTLNDYLKLETCLAKSIDGPETLAAKEMASEMFNEGKSLNEIIPSYLDFKIQSARNVEEAQFIRQLQNVATPERRSQIFTNYYCSHNPKDSPQVKNFKSKYRRLFEDGVSHDTVLSSLKKEADDLQAGRLSELKNKLASLKMAQSAHLKNKKKKAEKDQIMQDRDEEPRKATCGMPGCHRNVTAEEEEVECVVCDWLVMKGADRYKVTYCSLEHAEEDFDEHDRNDHQCCMGNRCYYNPQPGPPGETGAGGVCQNCAEEEIASYFCSQECYSNNLELHRAEFHYSRDIRNDSELLELFDPHGDVQSIA